MHNILAGAVHVPKCSQRIERPPRAIHRVVHGVHRRTRRLDGDSRKASGVPHVSLSESGAALRARRERREAGEKGPTAETHLPVDVYAGNRSDEHPSSATRVALCRRVRRRRRFPIKSESGSRKVLDGRIASHRRSRHVHDFPECEKRRGVALFERVTRMATRLLASPLGRWWMAPVAAALGMRQ